MLYAVTFHQLVAYELYVDANTEQEAERLATEEFYTKWAHNDLPAPVEKRDPRVVCVLEDM